MTQVAPVSHGAVSDAELRRLGLSRDDVVDFSVNSHPLGIAPEVAAAARTAAFDRYPEDGAGSLRNAIAGMTGSDPEAIAVGAGTVELLWHLARAFVRPGDPAVVVGPTFGEYARAVQTSGGVVHEIRATPPDFAPPVGQVLQALRTVDPVLLFVCNPNNPTGRSIGVEDLARLLATCPRTLVVCDEAYSAFSDDPFSSARLLQFENLCVLRSMTKDHALAGLRLGYLIAPPRIVDAVDRIRPPWNVSSPAIAAGIAAAAAIEHVERGRAIVLRERSRLSEELARGGFRVVPSDANFILVRVGNGGEFRRRLARHGLIVRDATSFGLPEWVRIAVRTPDANDRLLAAVQGLDGAADG